MCEDHYEFRVFSSDLMLNGILLLGIEKTIMRFNFCEPHREIDNNKRIQVMDATEELG
jgi:hypothetical protein